MGGNVMLKRDVVPHIFECQKDKKGTTDSTDEFTSVKRQRKCIVKEGILDSTLSPNQVGEANTSEENEQKFITPQLDSVMRTDENTVFNHPNYPTESSLHTTSVIYKSIGIQVRPRYHSKYAGCDFENTIIPTACSPIKISTCRNQNTSTSEESPNPEKMKLTATSTTTDSKTE